MEKNVRAVVTATFADFTGLESFDDKTEVFTKNNGFFFMRICRLLNCRTKYNSDIKTIGEYVEFFDSLIARKTEKKKIFVRELQEFVKEKTGYFYEPDEILLNNFLPKTEEKDNPQQYLREQMFYWNKMGVFKNQIRRKYNFFRENEAFFYARTINNFADALFMSWYRED